MRILSMCICRYSSCFALPKSIQKLVVRMVVQYQCYMRRAVPDWGVTMTVCIARGCQFLFLFLCILCFSFLFSPSPLPNPGPNRCFCPPSNLIRRGNSYPEIPGFLGPRNPEGKFGTQLRRWKAQRLAPRELRPKVFVGVVS